jgi:hypothetical protein
MKVQEYLGQGEKYFSESAGELVTIADMAPQYALNAWRKLFREFGCEFIGSDLCLALVNKFIPPPDRLIVDINKFGKAIIYIGGGGMSKSGARSRLMKCGADHTHLNKEWMEGHAPTVQLTVRGKKG